MPKRRTSRPRISMEMRECLSLPLDVELVISSKLQNGTQGKLGSLSVDFDQEEKAFLTVHLALRTPSGDYVRDGADAVKSFYFDCTCSLSDFKSRIINQAQIDLKELLPKGVPLTVSMKKVLGRFADEIIVYALLSDPRMMEVIEEYGPIIRRISTRMMVEKVHET